LQPQTTPAMSERKEPAAEKTTLHPDNLHRQRYDFPALIAAYPELEPFVEPNPFSDLSVNFFDPKAVKALNKALLMHHYQISGWDIPENYLCPPIPGRADYIHYLNDLWLDSKEADASEDKKARVLDIGSGANNIYPILGAKIYGWSFVGSETDEIAIAAAQAVLTANPDLEALIELRHQPDQKQYFNGIIREGDFFDLTICNPPFHSSKKEAWESTLKKQSNLRTTHYSKPVLNFGGQPNELWYEGGELGFITSMIKESKTYKDQVNWFTTLVAKSTHLDGIYKALERTGAAHWKTQTMGTGNKTTRIVAWSFK
jgi:23S rRNA (adenine1618-N6)-methyltransferase